MDQKERSVPSTENYRKKTRTCQISSRPFQLAAQQTGRSHLRLPGTFYNIWSCLCVSQWQMGGGIILQAPCLRPGGILLQVEILVPNMMLLESKAFEGQEGGDPRKRSAFTLEGPLRAFLTISGQSSEEVSFCGHVALRLPALTTKNRLPQASSLQNRGGEASSGFISHLAAVVSSPRWSLVTSGKRVSFKEKENNAGQKPRSTNTLVECHMETAQALESRRQSTHKFDILAVGLRASYSDSD